MTVLFILGILALITVKSSPDRFLPLAIFTLPAILFHCFAPYLQSLHYHVAGLFDVLVLIALAYITYTSRLIMILALTSVLSLFLNMGGWIIYELYYPPFLYDAAFIALYISVLIMVIGHGHTTNNRKTTGVYRFFLDRIRTAIKDH